MKISLIRTGGIIPVIKKATEDVDWSESEIEELLHKSSADSQPGKMRDSTQYQLMYNDKAFSIDIEKIPSEYKELFDRLKENMKIVKPS